MIAYEIAAQLKGIREELHGLRADLRELFPVLDAERLQGAVKELERAAQRDAKPAATGGGEG